MEPVPSTITKTYPPRGPLQQYRFAESTAFMCFRCGTSKKAKLITTYGGDWSRRVCNACYGHLLSLYEIKAGPAPDHERVDQLATTLLAAIADADLRQAEGLFRASEARAAFLTPQALRFIATAEHVAGELEGTPQLEWSPAVIGLCKAVEIEIVSRVLNSLIAKLPDTDLTADRLDKDLSRVAAYCADQTRKPPELGSFAHFLQTAASSRERRQKSAIIRAFFDMMADWSGSHWILEPSGLYAALVRLTTDFRNRAAHTDELSRQDYADCRNLVLGSEGLLWRLQLAATPHK
jgi:hypothetical protein